MGEPSISPLIRMDAAVHFATCGAIVTKDAKRVTGPRPNVLQKRVFDHYRNCQLSGKAAKILILKPRQTGASTVAQHLLYYHMQKYPGTNAAVMGDIQGTSDKVFNLFRHFAAHDPFHWSEQPNLKSDLADEIRLWNGSCYTKTTAGSKNAGRSGTVQAGNMTEPAFYRTEGGADPTLAFLNSAYDGGNECLYIGDSTPNGPQGWFYLTCMMALGGRTDWKLVFAAWFEFDEHRRAFSCEEERKEFEESLDADEKEEIERYKCDLEQMNWRRRTIRDRCGGEVAKFRQEYPSDIHECFLLSSRPRFNSGRVVGMLARAVRKPELLDVSVQENGEASCLPSAAGQWRVFEQPRQGLKYLLSVDLCTGEDQQTERGLAPDPDWHSAQVWRAGYFDEKGNWHLPRLAAHHRSRLEVAYLSAEIAAASIWYGKCLIVPEVNGPGLALVKLLREVHKVSVFQRRKVNDTTGVMDKSYGWYTDALTRKTIIDWLAKLIVDQEIDIPDPVILEEMQTFIVNRRGKPEAAPGMHDDTVLSAAIGTYNLRFATSYTADNKRRWHRERMLRDPTYGCPDGFSRRPLSVRGFERRRRGTVA